MKPINGSPTDRLLTLSLWLSPAITLVSSILYAVQGWDDSAGALLHIVGGILGALVIVRLVTYLDQLPWTAAAALVIGLAGTGGVIGYGFNTIEVGLGGIDLVDATGAATIKPLGVCWPLAILLLGIGLLRVRQIPLVWGLGIIVASALFPVSRIANIGWVAILADVVLLACLAAIPFVRRDDTSHNK
jgi:hypothetical protein